MICQLTNSWSHACHTTDLYRYIHQEELCLLCFGIYLEDWTLDLKERKYFNPFNAIIDRSLLVFFRILVSNQYDQEIQQLQRPWKSF